VGVFGVVAGVLTVAAVGSRRQLVSLRAYARHRAARGLVGTTLGAVQKAIATGRITPIDGKIDIEVADIQWAEKTDVVQQTRGARGGHAPKAGVAGQAPASSAPAGGYPEGGRVLYFEEKARREKIEADLAELELQERLGELLRRDATEREQFAVQRAVRDRMTGIPDRTAPIVAAETDVAKIHAILMAEIRVALGDVVKLLADAA